MRIDTSTLPELTGSEKQIAYANNVRLQFAWGWNGKNIRFKKIDGVIQSEIYEDSESGMTHAINSDSDLTEERKAILLESAIKLFQNTSAAFWLDNKNKNILNFVMWVAAADCEYFKEVIKINGLY